MSNTKATQWGIILNNYSILFTSNLKHHDKRNRTIAYQSKRDVPHWYVYFDEKWQIYFLHFLNLEHIVIEFW